MKCGICGKIIAHHYNFSSLLHPERGKICEECKEKLQKCEGGCKRCGRKGIENLCDDCLYWEKNESTKDFVLTNFPLYYYNRFAREITKQFKFSGDCEILGAFKEEFSGLVNNLPYRDFISVPVPLHEERLYERGFNQSLLIAKMLPFKIADIVEKTDNEKQSQKTKGGRLEFHQNFRLTDKTLLPDKHCLIVDDIYTTGATVHKIARLLADCGIKEIYSMTLFR